jgi:hypothetical protein
MKHAIITAADARCGDFLTNHWLVSLRDNVNLDNIDVIVLDYGLNDRQRTQLQLPGVICHPGLKDGNITNIRYRDMAEVLRAHQYDQVLAIDGGDVIFQADISTPFERHKDSFRAVCEEIKVPFNDGILPRDDFSPEKFAEITDFLCNKPIINGGVIFGPAAKFQTFWESFQQLWRSYRVFGTDQLIINYLLYKHGFVPLENKYNFAVVTMKARFSIRNGVFYDHHGKVIPIVHNAGMTAWTRCVRKFGYGSSYNKKKWLTPILLRMLFAVIRMYKRFRMKRHSSNRDLGKTSIPHNRR